MISEERDLGPNMVDFDDLLSQARQGAPKSVFTPHMSSIMNLPGFGNETQLRLLGNSIANCPENAQLLATNDEAIHQLLNSGPLGLQVLYNGTIDNVEFAEAVLQSMMSRDQAIVPSQTMRSLLGSVWEVCGSSIPRSFVIQLVIDGFVELVLLDESLEREPQVIANFRKIYEHCQKISMEAEDEDDFDSRGFRVVGNISSNSSFKIEDAKNIPEDPFTWETVILLSNLSAKRADIEGVLAKWPHMVDKTLSLIEAEDPEENSGGEEPAEDGDELDNEDEVDDPPFDLELWGTLLRNVARNCDAAKQISLRNPAKLFLRLLKSPNTQEIAGDFATSLCRNIYDHDLTEIITDAPHNGGSVLIVSALLEGVKLSPPPKAELEWALPRIHETAIDGMLADSNTAVWIKGSKTLAILCADYALSNQDAINKLSTSEIATQNDPVKQNLNTILRSFQ